MGLKILLWIARIWSLLSIAFFLFMFVGHLFGTEGSGEFSKGDMLQFFFFPICVFVGMSLAWFRVGLGAVIGTVGIIAFHVVRSDLFFDWWIDGLSLPCVLFLIYWLLSRGSKDQDRTQLV